MNDTMQYGGIPYLLYYLFIKKISQVKVMDLLRMHNNDLSRTLEYLNKISGHENEKLFPDSGSNTDTKNNPVIEPEAIMSFLNEKNIKVITIGDAVYPYILKQIYAPPPVLFYMGNLELINNFCIAVVGSRKCTSYGREAARYIAGGLSENGITVVSGMALGIDSEAHMSALEGKGKTIAVMGCGMDRVYPPENRDLFSDIIDRGLVLSEFFPGTPPYKNNFPQRNRVISGLCMGVVMVEAGNRSGASITCELALKQDRDVFAVPGNIFSQHSMGCHSLIKRGAKLVDKTDDIIEEFSYIFKKSSLSGTGEAGKAPKELGDIGESSATAKQDNMKGAPHEEKPEGDGPELNSTEKKVMDSLGYRPVSLERLVRETGLHPVKVMQALSALELKDRVRVCGTDCYCLMDNME
ncbi:MAG: DNA-processing protein DprA [Actinobacteria bacterium]|nr:DNA-processing protein DprA [Actinomycetota bacterium]